jgi:hypothetical protein
MKIRLITRQGQAALIEWTDDDHYIRRGIIPAANANGGDIDPDELARAIPYDDGPDLVKALGYDLIIPVDVLQNELRKAGIWTTADYLDSTNSKIILGVLQRLYGVDVATLQNIAAKEQEHHV